MRERPKGDHGQHYIIRDSELDALGNHAHEQVVVLSRVRVPAAVVDDVDQVVLQIHVLVDCPIYLMVLQDFEGGTGAKQGQHQFAIAILDESQM